MDQQQQREQLRSEYKLRPLQKEEEGAAIEHLPNGVYGFTYAPATETPLFARHSYHSFEVHKTSEGSAFIIAFVTPAEAEQLRSHDDDVDVTIFPEPYEAATTLVRIAFERVLTSLYKPVRRDGNAVPMKIAAA